MPSGRAGIRREHFCTLGFCWSNWLDLLAQGAQTVGTVAPTDLGNLALQEEPGDAAALSDQRPCMGKALSGRMAAQGPHSVLYLSTHRGLPRSPERLACSPRKGYWRVKSGSAHSDTDHR